MTLTIFAKKFEPCLERPSGKIGQVSLHKLEGALRSHATDFIETTDIDKYHRNGDVP